MKFIILTMVYSLFTGGSWKNQVLADEAVSPASVGALPTCKEVIRYNRDQLGGMEGYRFESAYCAEGVIAQ